MSGSTSDISPLPNSNVPRPFLRPNKIKWRIKGRLRQTRSRKCMRTISRFMMKLEPKKMPIFQRGILGLLFIVCVLLVIVLLPVNEKRSDEFLFKRNKALLGRPYNSTYPLTPPTSKSVCLLSAQRFANVLES